jgi:hypothetical protein
MLAALPDPRVRAFVVWEPVIRTDLAPPMSSALGRIGDRRVAQFWDPERLISAVLTKTARAHPERLRAGEEIPSVAWDVVLVYAANTHWGDDAPFPAYYGGPVVDVVEEVKRAIAVELRESR